MNPEYLREKTNLDDFFNPWIIVIGCLNDKSGKTLEEIYKPFNCPISYVSLREAEIQKYIHNIFNACKISFFNEMRMICDEINVDADKVFELVVKSAEGSWNHKYGIGNFGPYGGSCLPKDTTAFLDWFKKEIKTVSSMPVLEGVIEVNEMVKEKQNNSKSNNVPKR